MSDKERIRVLLPIDVVTLGKLAEGISEKFTNAMWVVDEADPNVMVIEVDKPRSSDDGD